MTLAKSLVVCNVDYFGLPTYWKRNSKLGIHLEKNCHGPRRYLRVGNSQPHSTTVILYPVFATLSGRSLTKNIWFTHPYANIIQMVINYRWKCTQQTGGGTLSYDQSTITYLHSTMIL